MRLHVLQHVSFEGPAGIADWAAAHGASLFTSHLYRGDSLPTLKDFDILAIMGGPMSVNDGRLHAWLEPEIALVCEAISGGKTILGVCLGAQMIAKALGARVFEGAHKEIGWFPVQRTESSSPIFAGVPAEFTALHWHGETFDLPNGATRLASTPVTPNQAFSIGERILGLQFHIEATETSASDLLSNEAHEIGAGPYEQSPGTIRAGLNHCAVLKPVLERVLCNLTGLAAAGK